MAVQAYPYLIMTDGTDTVTFQDATGALANWQLQTEGWTPQIAGVRQSELAGSGPYGEVVETITCNVIGTTAALCYANLETLTRLLDKASRWWLKNESISPVLLKYAPQGSTISSTATPLVATVLGRVGDEPLNGTALPKDMGEAGILFEIDGVTITFARQGVWTLGNESASVAAAANPAVLSVTMPSTPKTLSPEMLQLTGFTTAAATGAIDVPSGYVITGTNLDLQQAESPFSSSLAAGATYTSTADAAARASGGNVGRLAHAAAALNIESVLNFIPALSGTPTLVAVYCTYRNNTNSAWTIRASGGYGILTAASITQAFAPTVVIPGSATNPTVLYLGTLANRNGISFISLNIAVTAIVGAATLDFDTIVFVDLSTNEASVIAVNGARATLGAAVASQAVTLTVNNDPAVQSPDVRLSLAGGNVVPQSYSGPATLNSKGATAKAIWYATHLYGGVTPYWTTQNVGGSAILNIGATVSRKPGYVTPQ